jgi:hypothetical protein
MQQPVNNTWQLVSMVTDVHTPRERLLEPVFSIGSALRLYSKHKLDTLFSCPCVEADLNTCAVALRVIGAMKKEPSPCGYNWPILFLGDINMGTWPCRLGQTVKYGHESHRTWIREWLRWWSPAAVVNDRPILLSERVPHINKPKLSDSNKNLVLGPRWVLWHQDILADWPSAITLDFDDLILSRMWGSCHHELKT